MYVFSWRLKVSTSSSFYIKQQSFNFQPKAAEYCFLWMINCVVCIVSLMYQRIQGNSKQNNNMLILDFDSIII